MNGNSHFGSNEHWEYYITIIATIATSILLFKFFKDFFKVRGSEESGGGETNYAHIYLLISASFFFLQLFFKLIHLFVYSLNGNGVFVLDLFSAIFAILSMFMLCLLILFISIGWTIKPSVVLSESDLYEQLVFLGNAIFVMVVMFEKLIYMFEDMRLYEYQGFAQYVIIFVRLLFLFIVLYNVSDYKKDKTKIQEFMARFKIFAVAYLLSLPLVFMTTWFLPYEK